jgi:hypothetical protein
MTPTRRDFIAGAGVAAVATAPGAAHAAGSTSVAGVAPEAREAIGVIGTILQDARDLVGFGWLTHAAGLSAADLFTNPAERGAATARLRWYAEVTVTTLDVLPSLFVGAGTGRLRIFYAPAGGATPDAPDTFATGRLVMDCTGHFRNVQTVIAPDHAVTEVYGDLRQRATHRFVSTGRRRQLGRKGLDMRLEASGWALRTDATVPRSTRYVAGGISIPA